MNENHLRRIRIRRGTNAQRKQGLFEEGEFIYVNDIKRLYVGDNKTLGGVRVVNNNHVEPSAIRPINSDINDILYNKADTATYIINRDEKLKKIITSSNDIYKYIQQLNEIEQLLLKLEKLCCNTEFALDTDDGINILADYGDWIKVKDQTMDNACLAPIISDKYLALKSNKSYILNILKPSTTPDIKFNKNLPDRDQNDPLKSIKIIKDSVVSSKDIRIDTITDTTIQFTGNISDPKKVVAVAYIDYDIENECGVKQKDKASMIGIIGNSNVVEVITYVNERGGFTSSVGKYQKYKIIERSTEDFPWDKNCWFAFHYDTYGAADAYYITAFSKIPKLVNGVLTLDVKSYGLIGPFPGRINGKNYGTTGYYLFWHPKDYDLVVWNQGSGSSGWGCFPLFDVNKHVNDSGYYLDNESIIPTDAQVLKCFKSLKLPEYTTNVTSITPKDILPPFISL